MLTNKVWQSGTGQRQGRHKWSRIGARSGAEGGAQVQDGGWGSLIVMPHYTSELQKGF